MCSIIECVFMLVLMWCDPPYDNALRSKALVFKSPLHGDFTLTNVKGN